MMPKLYGLFLICASNPSLMPQGDSSPLSTFSEIQPSREAIGLGTQQEEETELSVSSEPVNVEVEQEEKTALSVSSETEPALSGPVSVEAQPIAKTVLPYVEAKIGYFSFTSSSMSQVYDRGGLDLQFSGAYPIYSCLSVYGSIEYLEKTGRSLGGGQRTSIQEIPLSLGLRATFAIDALKTSRYYLTAGPRYFFAQGHNHSTFVPRIMHAKGLGGFANMGFLFTLLPHLALDVFGEYSYVRLHFHSSREGTRGHTVQAGGLTFGGGLAYTF